jgi:branched-chain amino acid transport system substrate-binding protein
MSIRARFTTTAIGAVAAAVALAGCGSSAKSTAGSGSTSSKGIPTGPIKLGAVLSLTGSYAPVGQAQEKFYQLAVSTVNQQGGIAGHQIQLVVENDQDDPAIAVSAAQKLAAAGVVGVLNASGPDTDAQTVPVLMKDKIPVIQNQPQALFASNPAKYPYYFDNYPTFQVEAKAMISFLDASNQHNVGYLSDGSEFASELDSDLKANSAGGIKVDAPVTIAPTATDVSAQIQQIKSSGATALVLGVEEDFPQVYQAIEQASWRPVIVADPVITANPLSMYGSLASNSYVGCALSIPSATAKPSAALTSVVQTFIKKFGLTSSDVYFPLYVDAVDLIKAAVEHTHSVTGPALKAYLESVRNQSFSVPELHYTFTSSNHAGVQSQAICHISPVGPQNIEIAASSAS